MRTVLRGNRVWLAPAATVAVILAVAASLAVARSRPGVVHSVSPKHAAVDDIVRPGDRVVAKAQLVQVNDGVLKVCTAVSVSRPALAQTSDSVPTPPTCSPLAVPVTGFDASKMDTWTVAGTIGWALYGAIVTGTWTGDHIVAESVVPTPPIDRKQDPWQPVRCDPPAEGWKRSDVPVYGDPGGLEDLEIRLAGLTKDADRFGLVTWGLPIANDDPPHHVAIVPTVDDPETVAAQLHAKWEGNLCVVHTDRSMNALTAIAERIKAARPDWRLSFATGYPARIPITDLLMLDETAAAIIGPDLDKVQVHALLTKLR